MEEKNSENTDYLLKIENLNMKFKMPTLKFDTLKERVVNFFKGKKKPIKRTSSFRKY